MNQFSTDQEKFWSGQFGNTYIDRNYFSDQNHASNIALFTKILSRTHSINSVIEFGANIGLNLRAVHDLLPEANLTAVEINQKASKVLEELTGVNQVYNQSILAYASEETYDFVLSKGFLIHINPEYLMKVYQTLYHSSHRYICLVEYYNPTPVLVDYRGYTNQLFKRDFAGDFLDNFSDLVLVDYGFGYHRDSNFPQGDLNWFLLEKVLS